MKHCRVDHHFLIKLTGRLKRLAKLVLLRCVCQDWPPRVGHQTSVTDYVWIRRPLGKNPFSDYVICGLTLLDGLRQRSSWVENLVFPPSHFITSTFTRPDHGAMTLVVWNVVSFCKNTVTVSTFVTMVMSSFSAVSAINSTILTGGMNDE